MVYIVGKSLLEPIEGEIIVPSNDYEANYNELVRFIVGAEEEILIKCDNFGSILYDNPRVVGAFQFFFSCNSEGIVKVIFSEKSFEDKNDAFKELIKKHTNLFTMLYQLKDDWRKKFLFYWSPSRPKFHFSIRDDFAVALEQYNHPRNSRYILYYYGNKSNRDFVKFYKNKFNSYLKILIEHDLECNVSNRDLKGILKKYVKIDIDKDKVNFIEKIRE